jgi:hypothetical protein
MAKRLMVGLLKGALCGALLTVIFSKVLGPAAFAGAFGYLAVALTGVLMGLVAGKPLWAEGALIESSLKSVVGALFGAVALYAMRKWLNVNLPFGPLGSGPIGQVVGFALPAIAVVLGILFEIDNTGTEPATDTKVRVLPAERPSREAELAELEEPDAQSSNIGHMRGKS